MTDERQRRIARDVLRALGQNLDASPYAAVDLSETFLAATPERPPVDLVEAKAIHGRLTAALEAGNESVILGIASKALSIFGIQV